jgi:hypothetical protein
MNNSTKRIFFGAALILIGGLFLAQQIFDLPIHLGGMIIASLFALAGAAFLFVMFSNREHNWWAAIPGLVLVGLGALIASGELLPEFSAKFGGGMFLGFIGLAFLVVFLIKRDNWWAIIPMGVLFTLSIVAIMGAFFHGLAMGAAFFLGLATTFAIVGLLPVGRKEKWPWIPAGICAVIGTMMMVGSGEMMDSFAGLIWPGLLVLGGGYLIVRTFFKKNE